MPGSPRHEASEKALAPTVPSGHGYHQRTRVQMHITSPGTKILSSKRAISLSEDISLLSLACYMLKAGTSRQCAHHHEKMGVTAECQLHDPFCFKADPVQSLQIHTPSWSAVNCIPSVLWEAQSCLSEWPNFHLFLLMQAKTRRQEKSLGWVWTLPRSGTNIHEALSFQKVPPLPSMKLEMDELFYAGEKSLFSQRLRRTFSSEPSSHPTCTGRLKRKPQFPSTAALAYKCLLT